MSIMPSHAGVVAPTRHEPADSLDYFPTPPWATRALFRHVIGQRGWGEQSVWEPACGEGHMVWVLEELFGTVLATDIEDRGVGTVLDFLEPTGQRADWIITNPPFGDVALPFTGLALERARRGVALFLRTQALEGIGRYRAIYRTRPPMLVGQFVERVPLHKGRWEPDGGTLSAYCWMVWRLDRTVRDTRLVWIPPCRTALDLPRDRRRFAPMADAAA